jgi:UDP-MurNAc hydroxylase
MRVTFVSDSTFLFEHQGVRILTDPWIGTSIYGGAWMQYPPPPLAAEDIGRLDYIFISHIHEDHSDPATLAKLDRNATVVLMDRRHNYVERMLRRENFGFREIVNVPKYQPFALRGGMAIETIDADPGHSLSNMIDSAMILHFDGRAIHFANDCFPHEGVFNRLRELRVHLALLPSSGGSGYPACYANLSATEKAAERDRIVSTYLGRFVDAVERIRPAYFMTCAGNHVIAGRNVDVNGTMSFLKNPALAYRLAQERLSADALQASRPLRLAEGEPWEADGEIDADAAWAKATRSDGWDERRSAWLNEVASRNPYSWERVEVPAGFDWDDAFMRAGRNAIAAAGAGGVVWHSTIGVRLGNGHWGCLHPAGSEPQVLVSRDQIAEPYLLIEADSRLLYEMINGRFSWNIADAATFLTYTRVPNVYDKEAVIVLNLIRLKRPVDASEP